MEQKILQHLKEEKTMRADGRRNFVVFYTPEERKTVEYLEFCEANLGYGTAAEYVLSMSMKDAMDIKCVMEIYARKILEGGM